MRINSSKKSGRPQVEQAICGQLAGPFSAAVVLFHSALAERLGMNVTDFKCVAFLSEAGPITAGKLAEHMGLSTAATTLVVDRLERAGFVRRERDPDDRRKVILHSIPNPALARDISEAMDGLARSMSEVLSGYSGPQLETIARFLEQSGQVLQRVASHLKAGA